jgi:hypothetical protein
MLGCGCLSAPPRDGDEGVQEVWVLGVCVCVCVQEWGLLERGCARSICVGGVQKVWVLGVCVCVCVCKNGCWGCARMGVGACVQEWGLAERGGGVY